jgi:hypothetical protein
MPGFDMAYKARPMADRFWEKVDKTKDCWVWTAARQSFGYGKFITKKGTSPVGAHRLAYELEVGPIPEGKLVLHHCDNPPCVKPDHLYIGTVQDNVRDRQERGRWKRIKPHDQWGEKNPNAILSDVEVAAMLADFANGGRPVSVARKYGIQYRTLWAIRRRKAPGC